MTRRTHPTPVLVVRTRIALLALVASALALRLAGIDFGLPHLIEPDSELVQQVRSIRDDETGPRIRRDAGTYPTLIGHLTSSWSEKRSLPPGEGTSELQEHLDSAGRTFVDVRTTVALGSLLAIPAAFLLARRFLGPGWSLLAAAYMSFSVLHQTLAQQARPHGLSAVLVAWTLVCALWVVRSGSRLAYAAAGAMTFLSIGSLHYGVIVLPPLAWAHLRRTGWRRSLQPRLLWIVLAPFAALAAFYPELLRGGARAHEDGGVAFGNHVVELGMFDGNGAARLLEALWSYEPVLLVGTLATIVGVAIRSARRAESGARVRLEAEVLLAFAVPYLAMLSVYADTRERFAIPLLPCLAVLTAWGVAELAASTRSRVARGLIAGLVLGSLALPVAASVNLARIRSRPDTLEEARDWLLENGAPDARVVLTKRSSWELGDSSFDLPLGRRASGLRGPGGPRRTAHTVWTRYLRRLPEELRPPAPLDVHWHFWRRGDIRSQDGWPSRHLERNPADYFASTGLGYYLVDCFVGRDDRVLAGFRSALAKHGELRARFSPDGDPSFTHLPLLYVDRHDKGTDWPNVTLRLLRARLGPRDRDLPGREATDRRADTALARRAVGEPSSLLRGVQASGSPIAHGSAYQIAASGRRDQVA